MRMIIRVYGRVQGVFFRSNARDKALELGLRGWVRNRNDGSVEILAEGDKAEELFRWCREGPELAKVNRVEKEDDKTKEKLKGFRVLSAASV